MRDRLLRLEDPRRWSEITPLDHVLEVGEALNRELTNLHLLWTTQLLRFDDELRNLRLEDVLDRVRRCIALRSPFNRRYWCNLSMPLSPGAEHAIGGAVDELYAILEDTESGYGDLMEDRDFRFIVEFGKSILVILSQWCLGREPQRDKNLGVLQYEGRYNSFDSPLLEWQARGVILDIVMMLIHDMDHADWSRFEPEEKSLAMNVAGALRRFHGDHYNRRHDALAMRDELAEMLFRMGDDIQPRNSRSHTAELFRMIVFARAAVKSIDIEEPLPPPPPRRVMFVPPRDPRVTFRRVLRDPYAGYRRPPFPPTQINDSD